MLQQRDILNALAPDFVRINQSEREYIEWKQEQICRFIAEYTDAASAKGWVIGISGGIDSFLAGALLASQAAARKKRLLCVLLPNGEQKDLADAHACADRIREICPGTEITTVNIEGGYNGTLADLESCPYFERTPYSVGNIQPRLRMVYQYALAAGLLVCGTDHASEAITGFYTKYGDGGVDFNPLGQMVKDDIYEMSRVLGAPQAVLDKAPAAGIGISDDDESELGVSYTHICAYLKGRRIPEEAEKKIAHYYTVSAHKRTTPPTTAWLYRHEPKIVTHIHCGDGDIDLAVRYMEAHPEDEVLYWNVRNCEPFSDQLRKTVNTPLARYNMFDEDGAAQGEGWGSLRENVHKDVLLSGNPEDREQAEKLLDACTIQSLVGLSA